MTNITINPQNWVDDEIKVSIKGRNVQLHDETLTLGKEVIDRGTLGGKRFDFHTIRVKWNGQIWTTLTKDTYSEEWMCCESGIVREHKDPAILAAIMAANLI